MGRRCSRSRSTYGAESRRFVRSVLKCAVVGWLLAVVLPAPALAAAGDWPQYLGGPQHSSVSAAKAFTVANAAGAHQAWYFTPATVTGRPAPLLDASPTVVGTRVFIGSQAGVFYALNATTGSVIWKRTLDVQTTFTCPANGISATAAVVPDPVTGALTVYAAGARYLYALRASTGAVVWKKMIGPADPPGQDASYNWSSPTVTGGHIYMGLASTCDDPLVQGGVVELNQHSGALLNTWHSVPTGSVGASVWSSVAVSSNGHDVWVSTGNECDPTIDTCPGGDQIGDSNSIVHLSASLHELEAWQASGTLGGGQDSDFGSSPTLFGAGASPPDVGACNKNGDYYAFSASPLSAAPLWTDLMGAPASGVSMCLASAIWDRASGDLYLAGDRTTLAGVNYGGSLARVDPGTGAIEWQSGLPCTVLGTPSLDGAGVIAAATYTGCTPSTAKPSVYLIDAATGGTLLSLPISGYTKVFSQPVFANKHLYVATESGGLYAFSP